MIALKPKVSTPPANFSIADIYGYYVKKLLTENPQYTAKRAGHIANGTVYNGTDIVITYKQFKEILGETNKTFGAKLILGYTVQLLNRLGDLFIVRIERNPNNLKVNYHASQKLKQELINQGKDITKEKYIVYYTDNEYITLKHHRSIGLTNLNCYKFVAAKGEKGFRRKYSQTIVSRPALKALYPFIPYNY